MEFDRPLAVTLVHECDLVLAGVTTLLAEHADRVSMLPGDAVGADIALVDPYTRRSGVSASPAGVPADAGRVVVYTWETRRGFVDRAMSGGVDGYLSKSLPAGELVAALVKVHSGERLVALDEAPPRRRESFRVPPEVPLTPRESDVVAMIAGGAANCEIAEELELSMNTVKSHIRTAYRAMGVTSRTQAVLWAVEHGITAPSVHLRDDDEGAA